MQGVPAVSYDMPKPVGGFIGRTELLRTLAAQFGTLDLSGERETKETKEPKKSSSFLTANPQKLVLCTGLGGVGKTQLALQYAHTAARHYQHQFWFAADHPDALNAGYRLFAKGKNLIAENYTPDKDVVKAVNQWFASQSNWLIIYDNVERYEDIAPYLPTQGAGDILLTSRLAPIRWPKNITAITVDVLSIDEANQLIASLIDTPDDTDIPVLAMLLDCLPLALVQASAYIRENGIAVATYLNEYKKARTKYLLQQAAAPVGFPLHDPVFITWDISLKVIAKEEKAKGKQVSAKELLQFCAFLGPQKIPSRIVETWHTRVYPTTQELFTEARGRLHAYSLVQLDLADQSIQVHRLVQQVMREQLSTEEQAMQLQQTIELLTNAYPQEEVGVGKVWDAIRFRFIPHLEAVITYHAHYKLAEDTTLSLALFLLADAYGALGRPSKEGALLERALPMLEVHYGKDHWQVAITLNNLGTAYYTQGKVNKARDLLERALAIKEAYGGPEHYQVATTLMNLGNAYGDLGDVGKQRALLERALAIQEVHYGQNHYQVASTLNNLGNAYGALGQASKQRELLERALAIFEAHCGRDHYQVATTLTNLGNAYGDLGQAGKKRELLERALAIKETHYGRDHYQAAITLTNLGNAYGDLGQASKKRELLERALPVLEAHYGRDHYQVAITLENLGNAYGALEQVSKQRELLERALAIKETHYGPMHPEPAITLTNLALVYQHLKQPQAALHAAQRAYHNLMTHPDYGVEHHKTKHCLKQLQSAGGFTLAMLQSDDTLLEEKPSIQSSLPITSPTPQESQVAAKMPTSAFSIDSNAGRFNETVEFQISYNPAVYRYFSGLAEKIGNNPQGRSLITVRNSLSSASTTFTVSLLTAWLRQLHQNHPEDFNHICHQLGVQEDEMFTKIGFTGLSNSERKENKPSGTSPMPLVQLPPPSSARAALLTTGSISSSTSTLAVPSNNSHSSLTSHSSASLFQSTARQLSVSNPSSASFTQSVRETKQTNHPTGRLEEVISASKPKPPGGASGEET